MADGNGNGNGNGGGTPKFPNGLHSVPAAEREQFWNGIFLDTLVCNFGLITQTCEALGIARQAVYKRLNTLQSPEWREKFEEARRQGVANRLAALEDEAYRRAHDGVERRKFYQDQEIDRYKQYSDVLLIFLLKAAAPEKYRDRVHPEPSSDGVPATEGGLVDWFDQRLGLNSQN